MSNSQLKTKTKAERGPKTAVPPTDQPQGQPGKNKHNRRGQSDPPSGPPWTPAQWSDLKYWLNEAGRRAYLSTDSPEYDGAISSAMAINVVIARDLYRLPVARANADELIFYSSIRDWAAPGAWYVNGGGYGGPGVPVYYTEPIPDYTGRYDLAFGLISKLEKLGFVFRSSRQAEKDGRDFIQLLKDFETLKRRWVAEFSGFEPGPSKETRGPSGLFVKFDFESESLPVAICGAALSVFQRWPQLLEEEAGGAVSKQEKGMEG